MSYLRKTKAKQLEFDYRIFSHAHGKNVVFTLDELKRFSAELPLRCKGYLAQDTPITSAQQKELLLLADLSMQIWGGGPQGKLPYTHIEDYFASFYLVFCRYLGKLIPEKAGAWVSLCRYMGFDTRNQYFNTWKKEEALRIALEDLQFDLTHLYPDAYKGDPEEALEGEDSDADSVEDIIEEQSDSCDWD